MKHTKESIAEFLVKQWDYNPSQAPDTAEKFLKIEPSIWTAFESWLETGKFPEKPVFSGLSPNSLNKLCRLKPPAIFLLLDWIRREPKEALRAINDELIKH
jgi:hypothetical protein